MSEAAAAQESPIAAGAADAWCGCGRSATQPFCDGSHRQTSLTPVAFKAAQDGLAHLCGCKPSQGRPYSDGRRNRL